MLVKTVDDWRKALDRDEVVGTVLVDLSKAFDMIDHSKGLDKVSTVNTNLALLPRG